MPMSGNRPQLRVAPSYLAELSQQAARLQAAFEISGIDKLVKQFEQRVEPLIKAAKIMQEKIAKAFGKVKPLLRKYLLFIHQELQNILPVFVEKIFYKSLLLPNAYRSHSPPIKCVIKWSYA